MSLKLYAPAPAGWRVWKAQIAAEYNGVKVEFPKFSFENGDNKADWFLKLNPLGKVPTMNTPAGPIFESNAIARYVAGLNASTGLLGHSLYEQSQVNQWIDFITNEVEPPRNAWMAPLLGYMNFNQKVYTEAKKDLTHSLSVFNSYLLNHTFLAANHITLADIIAACALVDPFKRVFDPKFLSAYPNLVRWFNTVVNQKEFLKVVPKFSFATAEEQSGAAAGKTEKKTEAKKEEKKKEEKPKAAPKPAADDYDDEAPPPKKKHPLDDLPASPMVFDTIKKLAFSERPIKKDFFELLWPQFDNNGYSWWTCDYKYNDENKVFYMTGNAVGGFIQRSDACRKYGMGVMNIRGNEDEETGPFKVSGAWCFRGTEFLCDMKNENPDSEYYDWVRIDVTKPEGQAKIKEQFMAEKIQNEKVLDRRFFK